MVVVVVNVCMYRRRYCIEGCGCLSVKGYLWVCFKGVCMCGCVFERVGFVCVCVHLVVFYSHPFTDSTPDRFHNEEREREWERIKFVIKEKTILPNYAMKHTHPLLTTLRSSVSWNSLEDWIVLNEYRGGIVCLSISVYTSSQTKVGSHRLICPLELHTYTYANTLGLFVPWVSPL